MLKAVKGFEAFCSSNKSGLCVIAMPTGAGKTYHAIDYIAHSLLEENSDHIVFTTPLNKNVSSAYWDILERLFYLKGAPFKRDAEPMFNENDPVAGGIYNLFREKVIWLRSYEDNFKEVFNESLIARMRKSGFESFDAPALRSYLEHIKREEAKPSSCDLDVWRRQFVETERSFRNQLKRWIADTKKKGTSTSKFLSEHPWIGELYPSARLFNAKVIVLSIDKFLSYDDPIFTENRPVYLQEFTKGAFVFIDEFDATKEWILNRQIENASDSIVDLTTTHFRIQSALNGHYPYPPFDDGTDPNSTRRQISWLKKYFSQQAQDYSLDYTIKTDNDSLKNGVYLFDDGVDVSVVSKKQGYVSFALDRDNQNQLRLMFSEQKEGGSKDFVPTVKAFSRCRMTFIRHAVKMCRFYYENRTAMEKTFDANRAVSSVMGPFHDEKLKETVMDDYVLSRSKGQTPMDTKDFYFNGFRYYCFVDHDDEELTTSLNMIELRETPEKLLYSLVQRSRVIGLSATANVDTVTGNYAPDFLEQMLKKKTYSLSGAESREISEICKERLGKPRDIPIVPVESPTDEDEMPSAVFDDPEHQDELGTLLHNAMCKAHLKERFIRFLLAIKIFIHSDGHAMLLMSTDNPDGPNNILYTKKNIEEMCAFLNQEAGKDAEKFKVFAAVGKDYDKVVGEYLEAVKTNRVLLLSSYQSAGTGQNLQYEIELDNEIKRKLDIDTEYLEYPTNVVVDLNNAFSPDVSERQKTANLIKFLYQAEAMEHRHEISTQEMRSLVQAAFKQKSGGHAAYGVTLNRKTSATNHRVKILIQAVGRICRVANEDGEPPKNKRILVDSRILDLGFSCVKGKLLNPEFEALVDAANKTKQKEETDDPKANAAINNSLRLLSWIEDTVVKFDEDSMTIWKAIREYVLKHPTISKEDLDPEFEILYLESGDSLYYTNGSEDNPLVSWNKSQECPIVVSEKTARLDKLMEIGVIRDYFERNGYATSFGDGELMLNPVAFLNLYLGALGEASGRALLEEEGIALEEITEPSLFEKFDYRLAKNPNVYVDFKHWSSHSSANKEHSSEGFAKKLSSINGSAAYVINMLADINNPHSYENIIHFFPTLLVEKDGKIYEDGKIKLALVSLLEKE